MRVRVVAFATAAEALGSPELEIELPEGSRVADLQRRLVDLHPAFEALWPRLAVAVGAELAEGEAPLSDGDEVALLPPVSGGNLPATALVDGPLNPATATAAVLGPSHGAVVLFLGVVRDHHGGREVRSLTYSAYRPMAEQRLGAIARELEAGTPGVAVAVHHRLGELEVGETSVVIAAAAPHREAAYATSRAALERLKREVPIWKREHYADGTAAWREEEPLGAP